MRERAQIQQRCRQHVSIQRKHQHGAPIVRVGIFVQEQLTEGVVYRAHALDCEQSEVQLPRLCTTKTTTISPRPGGRTHRPSRAPFPFSTSALSRAENERTKSVKSAHKSVVVLERERCAASFVLVLRVTKKYNTIREKKRRKKQRRRSKETTRRSEHIIIAVPPFRSVFFSATSSCWSSSALREPEREFCNFYFVAFERGGEAFVREGRRRAFNSYSREYRIFGALFFER